MSDHHTQATDAEIADYRARTDMWMNRDDAVEIRILNRLAQAEAENEWRGLLVLLGMKGWGLRRTTSQEGSEPPGWRLFHLFSMNSIEWDGDVSLPIPVCPDDATVAKIKEAING